MENLKHTVAASIAVVLISSLAVAQANNIKSSAGSAKPGVWNTVSMNMLNNAVNNSSDEKDTSVNSSSDDEKKNDKKNEKKNEILDISDGGNSDAAIDLNIKEPAAATEAPVWDDKLVNVAEKVTNPEMPTESVTPFVAAVSESVIGESQSEVRTEVMGVSKEVVDESVGYVILSEGALNVRIAPSTDSEIVDQLDCASQVNITEKLDGWYKVTYGEDNDTGYVSSVSITHSKQAAEDARLKAFMYETGVAVVSEGALNIRSGAGTNFPVVDQLDNGEDVIVIEKDNEWLKVYYGINYDMGYVIGESISINGSVPKNDVTGAQSERAEKSIKGKGKIAVEGGVNVRSTPSETSSIISQIAQGSKVSILSSKEGWTKIAFDSNTVIGYVKSEFIKDADEPAPTQKPAAKSSDKSSSSKSSDKSSSSKSSNKSDGSGSSSSKPSSKGQAIVEEAKKYLGVKYVYGGSSPSGFDCSGLVQYVCRKNGISVSRSSREQFHNGVAVSRDNLQPGDLVFFQKNGTIHHVGIYVGNGQMIHAPQTGKTVSYQSINTPGRISGYAGARRVV